MTDEDRQKIVDDYNKQQEEAKAAAEAQAKADAEAAEAKAKADAEAAEAHKQEMIKQAQEVAPKPTGIGAAIASLFGF